MEIGHFKEIIRYSTNNKHVIEEKVKTFYAHIGVESDKELLNLMQIARSFFKEKEYLIVELPFKDKEIGALCYKSDTLGYMFLNTSLPKVNVNFALCHEIYHVFGQETEFRNKIELYINEHYYEHEEEYAANLFAGMLLMPEQSYRQMFQKFQNESKETGNELTILVKLMNYFEVPYMAALIRCYELKLFESGDVLEKLMKQDGRSIREEFARLWLDEDILNATRKDDFARLVTFVEAYGELYQIQGYLSVRTVDKALQNMRELYIRIKGD